MHDVITCVLVYLVCGSCTWVVMDGSGLTRCSFEGQPVSRIAIVLASLMMIVAWPVFAWEWVKGLRGMRR